jgi:hypothetical protein
MSGDPTSRDLPAASDTTASDTPSISAPEASPELEKPGDTEAGSIRKWDELRTRGIEQWREAVLAEAVELWRVRRRFGRDNNAFGWWLEEHQVKLPPNDREALIAMGRELDGKNAKLIRDIVATTSRHSLQLIWREEIKPNLPLTEAEIAQREADAAARANRPKTSMLNLAEGERMVDIARVLPARMEQLKKAWTRGDFEERVAFTIESKNRLTAKKRAEMRAAIEAALTLLQAMMSQAESWLEALEEDEEAAVDADGDDDGGGDDGVEGRI